MAGDASANLLITHRPGWIRPGRYFLNAFNLILSMHEIPPNNPTSVEVRQYIEGSPR